jgi:IS605 OrfB family transposase
MPNDAHFINSAVKRAEGIYKSAETRGQDKITFGQKAFDRYHAKEITKDQLKKERAFAIYSIGEANQKGNRKYNFLSYDTFVFKPDNDHHFGFRLYPTSKNRIKYLKAIHQLANNKLAPITVTIDKKFIYFTFDIAAIQDVARPNIQNSRILGVDMNPNNFGYVIKDQSVIYQAEKLDFMDLRLYTLKGFASDSDEKKNLTNKKNYEVIQAAYYVVEQAIQFHCEAISLEQLDGMKGKTKNKHFNRAVNNDFKRTLFKSIIQKLCAERNIKFIEIMPAYTSFWGHVKYHHKLDDPCSAAACIADAGMIGLDQLKKGEKRQCWFKQVMINRLLYVKNSYLNRWNETDLNFDSIEDLHKSIKKLLAKGSMYASYHVSSRSCKHIWFKSRGSSVKRLMYKLD